MNRRNRAPSHAIARLASPIAHLRKLLKESRKLEEIWQVFDERLATNDVFLDLGRPAKHSRLKQVIEAVVPRAVSSPGRLLDLRLLNLSSYGMWHGIALFEAAVCTALYFEPDDRGFLVISRQLLDPCVHFARVSVLGVSPDAFPVPPPAGAV